MSKPLVTWEEAAQPCTVTPLEGEPFTAWLSKDGHLCNLERTARYFSCTVMTCEQCGVNTHAKPWGRCQECREKNDNQRLAHKALGRPVWDGTFPVWVDEKFCDGEEDILDLMRELDEKEWSSLVVYEACPNNGRRFGFEDFLEEVLPENHPTRLFKSPEAKELEAKVNAFLTEHSPYSYSCEMPFALSSFDNWLRDNKDSLLGRFAT